MQEIEGNGYEIAFDLGDARKIRRAQGVGLGELEIGVLGNPRHLLVDVKHVHEHVIGPVGMAHVDIGAAHLVEDLSYCLTAEAVLGKYACHGSYLRRGQSNETRRIAVAWESTSPFAPNTTP